MNRHQPQRSLTIGDGFRIGFGVGFWMVAWTLLLWLVAVVGLGALALVGA